MKIYLSHVNIGIIELDFLLQYTVLQKKKYTTILKISNIHS